MIYIFMRKNYEEMTTQWKIKIRNCRVWKTHINKNLNSFRIILTSRRQLMENKIIVCRDTSVEYGNIWYYKFSAFDFYL